MKVLHLTSFQGNSGDTVNHASFHTLFRKFIDADAQFTCTEIRQFYRNSNERHFDAEFAKEINTHDLFILGGGLHFDARWPESSTGTTLDFSDEFIDSIQVPVLINAMGYAERLDNLTPTDSDLEIFTRFEAFIRKISHLDNWFLTLRNDGSRDRIAKRYGEELASLFEVIPDTGFFFDKDIIPYAFEEARPTIGFCVANDTFTQDFNNIMNIDNLNSSIAECIKTLAQEGFRIILFSHIPKDFETLNKLYTLLGDKFFRFHVVVAPYNPLDKTAARTLVSYYKACDCIVPMRFHANIIPMQNGICSVGLTANGIICCERIPPLYVDAGLEEFTLQVDTRDKQLSEILYRKIHFALENKTKYKKASEEAMQSFESRIEKYMHKVYMFLQNFEVKI